MLRRVTIAAAVLGFAAPALSDDSCLPSANGAQCDVFLEKYRADEVPTGTTDFSANKPFVIERLPGVLPDPAVASPVGEDVLVWDGDSAMVVPEDTGPRLEIADW